MSRTVLITGAGRGIGRRLAERFLGQGATVIATARDDAALADLKAAGAETIALEVTDQASIDAMKARLGDRPIDVLVNNAGVIGNSRTQCLGDLDREDWIDTMRINVVAPFAVTEALVDNVMASSEKKIVIISSIMGSVSVNAAPDMIIYRSSKAAVNQVAKAFHNDLSGKGVIVVPMHPGWVSTDMGGEAAPVTPQQSAEGLANVINNLSPAQSGRLWDFQGEEIAF